MHTETTRPHDVDCATHDHPEADCLTPEVTITGDGITGDIVTWRSWRPGGPRLVHVDAEGAVLTGDGLDVVIAHLTALRGTCG